MNISQRLLKAGCAVSCGVGAYATLSASLMAGSKFGLVVASAEAAACLILAKQALIGPDDD